MGKLAEDQMKNIQGLAKEMPEAMKGFMGFMHAVEADGALSAKTKELITLALAVKSQCEYCIAIHVKKNMALGSTREEMLEACMMSVLMGGGPALMYVKVVNDAITEYSEKKE